MSPLAAPLATFLLFSGIGCLAAVQISAPNCTSSAMAWTFNSIKQNACMVAAYMMSTCNGGSFTIDPLMPGYSYLGPTDDSDSHTCRCNTVTYSLLSACGACQGESWITWSQYSSNCTKILPPSTFPETIPSGTRVPQWALIDVTSEGTWDANKSLSVGDSPEQGPGAVLGFSGATASASGTGSSATSSLFGESSSTVDPTSSSSTTSSPTPKSSSSRGFIIDGVVGGVAAIFFAGVAIGFILRRRRQKTSGDDASEPSMDEIQWPLATDDGHMASSTGNFGTMGSSSIPETPVVLVTTYDSNDSSTFPGHQGVLQTLATPPHRDVPPLNGTRNSLTTTQTSLAQGYHGLPTV